MLWINKEVEAEEETLRYCAKYTITYVKGQRSDYELTIDLILASENLIDSIVKCAIYRTEYRSDYCTIKTVFDAL
ncbi:uncharacterized protein N7482_010049 [Penicillium canariense]|uniref:Uncharacterized protein n=1 Tax=Penicillium canariense TaxID=189055 RepID=A0A9W9HSH8_9EURO|nr:uncharacterized protein N7482_010049 [Penicillium canariense]KAJ5153571.1 hypothetical protein N7482_010049 [Penicillium canariense]